jgi:hypothetical protein
MYSCASASVCVIGKLVGPYTHQTEPLQADLPDIEGRCAIKPLVAKVPTTG